MSSWLPSHAKITVKEGRELRLKGRGGQGDLYVSLNVDRETLKTGPVPRSSSPTWNHAFDITLMSLDTTIHLTVHQAGKFRESFIGYLNIFLGGFKLTNKPTSHWYKLGSKPGKPNTKLRGDILITVTFYSDWAPVHSEGSWAESRFRRTMSLRHSRQGGGADKEEEVPNGKEEGKGRGSLFGLSVRKKKPLGGAGEGNELSSFKTAATTVTPTVPSISSQASTPVLLSAGGSDTWTSYTLPVRGKGNRQSSGPSTGSDSPSSEARSAEGGGGDWSGEGGGGGGEGEAGVGFRRGSGGSMRRRARPRSIPDTFGHLPGTEQTSASSGGGVGDGDEGKDTPSTCKGTSSAGAKEMGGSSSTKPHPLTEDRSHHGDAPGIKGGPPHRYSPDGSGVEEVKNTVADCGNPARDPTGPDGDTPTRRPDPDRGQGSHLRSQTQTAPPRLTSSADAGGGSGEDMPIKRMQSMAEFVSHGDKAGSPRCTTPSNKSPPSAQYTRAEAPLFVNEKTPINIKVAKKLNLSPTPIIRSTSDVDAPTGVPSSPPPAEMGRSGTPDKPAQSVTTLSLKGRRPAGGGGGLKRALTSYQENKKVRGALGKSRTDRPSSASSSRESMNDGVPGVADMTGSASEASRKDQDIGISAALLMAIRTKSRTSAAAQPPPQSNDSVARQHSASINVMSPPSEEAQLGPVVPPKGPQGQQRAPIEQASDPSIHSGDSRPVSCEGTSLADCDFESMSTEDWAKWSKEDLIKALLKTRERLKSTDQELEALHSYLKRLLDRIMETNPELLQIS